jgi:hypothetical protein
MKESVAIAKDAAAKKSLRLPGAIKAFIVFEMSLSGSLAI